MSATPIRPEPKPEMDETEKIIRDRNATFEDDKKTAAPWAEVKRRILETPFPR